MYKIQKIHFFFIFDFYQYSSFNDRKALYSKRFFLINIIVLKMYITQNWKIFEKKIYVISEYINWKINSIFSKILEYEFSVQNRCFSTYWSIRVCFLIVARLNLFIINNNILFYWNLKLYIIFIKSKIIIDILSFLYIW